jgi:hypothetical protein
LQGILTWLPRENAFHIHLRLRICFAQDDAVSIVLDRFPGKPHLRSPFLCQVLPAWVECFNQSDLLLPPPTFQLPLAIDGFSNIIKALELNETIATVLAGKPLKLTALVVQNSPVEIVGHSNVKGARAAADDVDAIFLVVRHSLLAVILSEVVVRKANDHAAKGPCGSEPGNVIARNLHWAAL